jgi:hypothetical protein
MKGNAVASVALLRLPFQLRNLCCHRGLNVRRPQRGTVPALKSPIMLTEDALPLSRQRLHLPQGLHAVCHLAATACGNRVERQTSAVLRS